MKKLKHLEGLRGIAAIIVVFHHVKISCYNAEMNQLFRKINELESIYLEALNTFSDGLYFPRAVYKIPGQIIREKEGQDKHS
jgi:hypothetical protein